MVFGSGMTGIKITRLNAQTGKLLDEENPQIIGLASRARGDKAIEAGYMVQRGDDYYLFVAAGPMSPGTYFNGVGRGESVTGPFYARDGVAMMDGGKRGGATLITEPKEGIDMPGHCAPFQDDDGQWYFLIEYFPEGYGAKLGISTMVWDEEGWPWTALTADVVGKLGTGPVK